MAVQATICQTPLLFNMSPCPQAAAADLLQVQQLTAAAEGPAPKHHCCLLQLLPVPTSDKYAVPYDCSSPATYAFIVLLWTHM
jgi:hypothetical protein